MIKRHCFKILSSDVQMTELDWKYGKRKATKTAALRWRCLWWKRTLANRKKFGGVGYVKPGGLVKDAFKQKNYWKKKAGKNQFISVYMNEVASLGRNSLQKNKSKLYCPFRCYAAMIGLQQHTFQRRSALTINALCSLRRNVCFAKTGDYADIAFNGDSYHTQ